MPITLIMVWKFWLASFHFNSQTTCHDSRINVLLKKQLFCYERVKFIQQPVVTIQTFKVMEGSGREFGTFSIQIIRGFIIISKLVYFITKNGINVSTTKTQQQMTVICSFFLFLSTPFLPRFFAFLSLLFLFLAIRTQLLANHCSSPP